MRKYLFLSAVAFVGLSNAFGASLATPGEPCAAGAAVAESPLEYARAVSQNLTDMVWRFQAQDDEHLIALLTMLGAQKEDLASRVAQLTALKGEIEGKVSEITSGGAEGSEGALDAILTNDSMDMETKSIMIARLDAAGKRRVIDSSAAAGALLDKVSGIEGLIRTFEEKARQLQLNIERLSLQRAAASEEVRSAGSGGGSGGAGSL